MKNNLSFKKPYYQGPQSNHFDGKRFFNPWQPQKNSFFNALLWKMTTRAKKWLQKHNSALHNIPPQRVEGNQLQVSFIGHSTMLIQTQGLNIITDPVWARRASPFRYLGPKRYTNPGILLKNLPPIDLILISHNHYDHLDLETIKQITKRNHPKIITPLGNDVIIHRELPQLEIQTLDWHQMINWQNTIGIHLVPVQHWSARGLWDRNKALWGGFVLTTKGGNIFFCGDSGYGTGDIFRDILKKFGSFRFAMIPIGAYEPRWFMKYAHMNPVEAFQTHQDLGSPYSAAIHFETFKLTDEGFAEPRKLLNETCAKHSKNPQKFRALKIGETWVIP